MLPSKPTRFIVSVALVALLSVTACEKKKTTAELQAEKVAAFRKRQRSEAVKAYQQLVTKYPDSDFAAKAQARLKVLGTPPPTASPGAKKQ